MRLFLLYVFVYLSLIGLVLGQVGGIFSIATFFLVVVLIVIVTNNLPPEMMEGKPKHGWKHWGKKKKVCKRHEWGCKAE